MQYIKNINKKNAQRKKNKKKNKMGVAADKLADHLCNCSCDMYNNGRKAGTQRGKGKKTIQEQKFDEASDYDKKCNGVKDFNMRV